MTGKSHIATGIATAAIFADGYALLSHTADDSMYFHIATKISEVLIHTELPLFVYVPLCVFLYLLGVILPDIDYPYSMIGKHLYLPFGHRTWTHCWLPLTICGIAGIWCHSLWFLGLGMFVHILFDSFSASGIQWLYPAKIKYRCPLYHTSSISEYVVMIIWVMIAILFTLGTLQHIFHLVTISFT